VKILILGATGSIGRHLVPQALDLGHEVTVLVRDATKLGDIAGKVRVISGDALNATAVQEAARGQDAVIYSLGRASHRSPTTMFSESTAILLQAMKAHGVRRLIAITGIGCGETKGHGGFLYDRLIFPFITRETYRDKDRQESMIRESGLDWTIVRPASFTDGQRRGNLRAETKLDGVTIKSISRADTAAFVLEQLSTDRFLRQSPLVGY
jgi:putative NADH-flavin reductase